MNKNYLILTILALILGFGILFMPDIKHNNEIKPEKLLLMVDEPSRFLSSDVITDRLVKKDPALVLIDVRSAAEFKTFAIPGSINIPMDSLLETSSLEIMGTKDLDKVFYSNADVAADQAWIICKRMGFETIYVMQGGLNNWFNTIVKAEKPADTEPIETVELYQFRKGASQYFYGNGDSTAGQNQQNTQKKTTILMKKEAGASSGGGC